MQRVKSFVFTVRQPLMKKVPTFEIFGHNNKILVSVLAESAHKFLPIATTVKDSFPAMYKHTDSRLLIIRSHLIGNDADLPSLPDYLYKYEFSPLCTVVRLT